MDDALDPVRELLPGSRLDEIAVLSDQERATVRRVRAHDEDGERTLIVKQFHGAGEEWVREAAMLACLPPGTPAPRLVAERAVPQIVVVSDLDVEAKQVRGIAEPLLGEDPVAAGQALIAWARALATLHVATRELRERFGAELDSREGDLPVRISPMRGEIASAGELLGRHCASLGVAMPSGTADQLEQLVAHTTSGPCALTPHDTCPDNCILTADGVVLIDFEGAQWRNVAWDVAYLLVPWPTCWCSWAMPSWAASAAVEAYREVAGAAFPEVADEGFAGDLEIATVGWAFESTVQVLDHALAGVEPASTPRKPMPRRRGALLHRLDCAAATATLPALAELAGRLAAELRERWGEEDALPLAPAFRSSADR